jgi:hypothetical protein
LPVISPRAISSLIVCDGRMPLVRASLDSLANSPNNPTSPFLKSELDIVQNSRRRLALSETRRGHTISFYPG